MVLRLMVPREVAFRIALMLSAIAGHDPADSTSVKREVPDYLAETERTPLGLRIGYPRALFGAGLDAGVRTLLERAIDVYRASGAEIVEIEHCFPRKLEKQIATQNGFKGVTHKLEFYGLCPRCQ